MRVVFMGTPEFAVPSLRAVAAETIAVYTQPDRPAGRGRRVSESAVKQAARELGLPVHQPANLRPAEEVDRLRDLAPDLIVVAAFGQILRPNVISIPRHGILNVHASLLPRWRGASPVSAAILAGDVETGVTIMRIDPGLDTGPTISHVAIPIDPHDTTGTLTITLAEAGATLLADTIPVWVNGTVGALPQDESLATIAPRLTSEDGILDWTQPVDALDRRIRAVTPWPGASTSWRGQGVKILAAHPIDAPEDRPPGTVLAASALPGTVLPIGRSGLVIMTGDGLLQLDRLQLAGGKPLDAGAFRAGQQAFVGSVLPS